jgi:class 3 adenylate cyclase/pimeloyl-ACP methyl ester carboxylesterase
MDLPETRYAKSGDVRIAYQVTGSGPFDIVWVTGFVSNLDLEWESPPRARFFSRLSAFSRLIRFDKRGTGLSDRVSGMPHLEARMDDVRAVMDAAHCDCAAVIGASEGGAMSMLFAATYPQRTRALVLYGTYAHYPTWVLSGERLDAFIEAVERGWGTGETVRFYMPSKASDANFRRQWARLERQGGTPSAAIALTRMNSEIDVRHILAAIRVPTLVLHRTGDPRVSVEAGRYLGRHIPGANYVELPGEDHGIFDVEFADRLADKIEEFLTGSHTESEPDRVLATVLFTDIVDSTKRAVELGDRRWRLLRGRHDDAVRQELARFRGREVKSLGDGFLATFDGPARAVRCASAIIDRVRPLSIEIRSGLHTGEIEVQRDDIGGIAVHIAARVAELAGSGEVLVSTTVRDLVAGSGLSFQDRGSHSAKGLSEPLRLFAAQARREEAVPCRRLMDSV